MSNTKRPTLQKRTTRATETARKAELDAGIAVMVDGTRYAVRMGDLTSMDAANLRRATGFSFRGLMMAASKDPDIDIVAAIVWLSRRIDGELMLDYETVAQEIGYDAEVDLADVGDDDTTGDDLPEA